MEGWSAHLPARFNFRHCERMRSKPAGEKP